MNFGSRLLILGLIASCWACQSDERHGKYGLTPINTLEEYQNKVNVDPSLELIDLEKHITDIQLDIRYSTSNNFVKEPVYKLPKAYSRLPVANALKSAQSEFIKMGFSIKVFDGYRPYSVTVKFYELYPDTTYVASPYSGSRHNRGAAIDLTLVHLDSGVEMEMGTAYDDFTELAHPTNMELDSSILKNRELLISTMNKHGFDVYPSEWWHFDYQGWEKFDLLDLSFEQLEANQ